MFSKERHSNRSPPTSPSRSALKLRGENLTNPLVISEYIDQYKSQANYITHLDISHSITNSATLKHFCIVLGQIRTLIAVECNLSHIDEDTPWPPYLRSIDFSRNRLTSLPQSLSNLLELTELNLSGNLITKLDSSLLVLPRLQKIHLLNNPIQNVPKSVCREGLMHLRQYFQVSPLPSKGSVGSADRMTSYLSSFIDSDTLVQQWPQFDHNAIPDGYTKAVCSYLYQVYVAEGCNFEIAVEIVKDVSLYPKVKANELLISPVVHISPNGAQFSESEPAIIVVDHCTKPSTSSPINILPLYSNTSFDQCPHWENLSTKDPPKIFQDCVMFSATHFSLFAVVASVPYPSKSIIVSPEEESLLLMQELPGFRILIPSHSVAVPTTINTTVYYSDPPYGIEMSAASACIGVEPSGIRFESPLTVSIPIPHFNEIKKLLPNASLQLYHSSGDEMNKDSLQWELAQDQHHEITTENDTTIVTFETTHFTLMEWIWTVGQGALCSLYKLSLGASNTYKYLTNRSQFVSVRCQVFMTRPSTNLSFGLAVCVFKFGEPLQELSNYPWLVSDSGPKGVDLRVGELRVALKGHFTANKDMNEGLEVNKTLVNFNGDDFCVRMDFALKLLLGDGITLPLNDGQILGKITFTQMNGDRPTVISFNMIKVILMHALKTYQWCETNRGYSYLSELNAGL